MVTEYPTARNQVSDGVDGLVVPMDNEGCAEGIAKLLNDDMLIRRISSNLSTKDFGNLSAAKGIDVLLS